MSNLKKLLAKTKQMARYNMERFGFLATVALVEKKDGAIQPMLQLSLKTEGDRQGFEDVLKQFATNGAVAVVIVIEAWVVEGGFEIATQTNKHKIEHGNIEHFPGRKEAGMVSYYAVGEVIHDVAFIQRTSGKPELGYWESRDDNPLLDRFGRHFQLR